ncbi:CDGSH iron-sulfur domain-containing protein 3, mitochondrial [Cloeon dipterum]|uniref:CDGSH iron-sulfur domain-containing protein 3, mitochondrial n=1 Tax=Cloeon dipterum TaxID=197152 RepID=UPI0032208234
MACLLHQLSVFGGRRVLHQRNSLCNISRLNSSTSSKKEDLMPKNLLRDKDIATDQKEKGAIYDKRPFKFNLEANKKYAWCSCGKSKNQPFCDGTHKDFRFKITMKPVIFMVADTKEYYLCNCKQTENRPFCDGTHKRQDIQDAVKY